MIVFVIAGIGRVYDSKDMVKDYKMGNRSV